MHHWLKKQKVLAALNLCALFSCIGLCLSGPTWAQQATPQSTSPLPTPTATNAPTITPKAALERLFTSQNSEAAWFSDAFLAQVPVTQLEGTLAQVTQQLGKFLQVEGEASPFTVMFARGQMTVEIGLDAQGRISGLLFHPPTPTVTNLAEALAKFKALPGDVSVLVVKDSKEITAVNPTQPLAVGSAFKLAVLATLQEQIKAKQHKWDEVVQLDPAWKSLPGGVLQTWPDKSPLTLHTLATLMISISDNTAADSLIHVVGQTAVETHTARNQPFLTTQELFKLKAPTNAALLARYRNGNEATKRQVLAALDKVPLPTVQTISTQPMPDVEWHFTTRELCTLMDQVEALDVMTVEPGPAITNRADWARIAYKGGSDAGVLNLTYWLKAKDGATYCVTATQNSTDAAINEGQFFGLVSALLGVLP